MPRFYAFVQVKDQTVQTSVDADHDSQARALLEAMYGSNNVVSWPREEPRKINNW